MAVGVARKGWDIDLADGVAREGAFREMMLAQNIRYFEHKSDEMCRQTGNVFVELEQRISGAWRRSGLAVSEADGWAFEYFPRCWLTVPTTQLRILVDRLLARSGRAWTDGGDHNNYRGVLVPLHLLLEIGQRDQE
jgi:hypothetical protein